MSETNYDLLHFLRALRGPDEPHHLVAIDPQSDGPGNVTGREFPANADGRIAKFIDLRNGKRHHNAYFTLNRVKGNPKHGKARKRDISAVLGYGVDLDPPDDCEDLSAWRDKKVAELQESSHPPTAIWCTGSGLQAVWVLAEPIPIHGEQDWQQPEAINAALARRFGGDATQNIDRLFRLPGTTNYPDAKKRAKGREDTTAFVIEGPNDRRYAPDDFADLVSEADAAILEPTSTAPPAVATGDPDALMAELLEDLQQRIRRSVPKGQRSEAVCKVVRSAFEHGLSPDQVETVLAAHPDGVATRISRATAKSA